MKIWKRSSELAEFSPFIIWWAGKMKQFLCCAWFATQAGKIELFSPFGTTRVPQKKYPALSVTIELENEKIESLKGMKTTKTKLLTRFMNSSFKKKTANTVTLSKNTKWHEGKEEVLFDTAPLSAFSYGRAQHVRRMRSCIVRVPHSFFIPEPHSFCHAKCPRTTAVSLVAPLIPF